MRQTLLTLLATILCTQAVFSQQQDTTSLYIFVDDISVVGNHPPISSSDENGNISINIGASQNLPRFAGSLNYMRLLQYTPGVSASSEGSGIVVRGGDYGQNRIILNGAPLYSPPHLFDFMPIINSSHTEKLTLVKSNIPIEYGSASSSIIDIRTHSQRPQQTTIDGEFGLIGSSIALQVPIGDRFAVFASARKSHVSWLVNRLYVENKDINYEFYDFELGMIADLGKVGTLTVNSHYNRDDGFLALDRFSIIGEFGWWNGVGSAILTTRLSDNIVMENTIYTSSYSNDMSVTLAGSSADIIAGIQDSGLRNVTTFVGKRAKIMWGLEYANRKIAPQHIYLENLLDLPQHIDNTHEMAVFASSEWSPHPIVRVYSGIRMSMYLNGKRWAYPEPRIMLTFPLNSTSQLWANYNMMAQYLQLVPQSNTSLATDFYIGAAEDYQPQRSHNFSIGYKQRTSDGAINWSVEAFYRRMFGVIEFNKLISHFLSTNYNYNSYLHSGDGVSYGVETSLSYIGKICSIRANYTLGRSLRQIDSFNNGEAFPAHSDRRHTLSLLATYDPSPRWVLSATFILASGAPYTAPTSFYLNGGTISKEYSSYNGARLPATHHLDLSAGYRIPSKHLRENLINISIYNVYAQKNPLMISWETRQDSTNANLIHIKERKHIIYTIVPSVSWSFKF